MKIYLASSFSLIPQVETVAAALEEAGHEITCKWWSRVFNYLGEDPVKTSDLKKRYDGLSPDEFYSKPECGLCFKADFKGVKDAEILVLIVAEEARAYNGANIELGIALSDHKRCFSLGTLDNSVLYWPVIRCNDLTDLINKIHTERRNHDRQK